MSLYSIKMKFISEVANVMSSTGQPITLTVDKGHRPLPRNKTVCPTITDENIIYST